jgi:hypothetical protein
MPLNNAEHVARLFYEAFAKRDGESMIALYDEGSNFFDPVFQNLKSSDAKDMWRMLCQQSADLRVDFTVTSSNEQTATVLWNAYYTFTKTGRKVHNRVQSELVIEGGKIVSQKDRFSFWRWSMQAFGMVGVFLGWTPIFRRMVHRSALASLRNYQARKYKNVVKNT